MLGLSSAVAAPAAAPGTGDATQWERSAGGAGENAMGLFLSLLPQLLETDIIQPLTFLF